MFSFSRELYQRTTEKHKSTNTSVLPIFGIFFVIITFLLSVLSLLNSQLNMTQPSPAIKPMATSSTVAASANQHEFAKRTTSKNYNPTMMAILTGTRMQNCEEIKMMRQECLASGSKASICQTAAQYMSACIQEPR